MLSMRGGDRCHSMLLIAIGTFSMALAHQHLKVLLHLAHLGPRSLH